MVEQSEAEGQARREAGRGSVEERVTRRVPDSERHLPAAAGRDDDAD